MANAYKEGDDDDDRSRARHAHVSRALRAPPAADFTMPRGALRTVGTQPTLNPSPHRARDRVLLDRWSIRVRRRVDRGDIVVARSVRPGRARDAVRHVSSLAVSPRPCRAPDNERLLLVKRIVALEGDRIWDPKHDCYVTMPPGHCWLTGDNAAASVDSRAFGPLPVSLIIARVVWILWPLRRFGALSSHPETPASDLD